MSNLSQKLAALTANIQSTLIWSGIDFQNAIGFAIVPYSAQLAFSVQNNTSQVVYVGVQYNTLYDNINLLGGRNAVAIPANTTVNLDQTSNPILNTLQRDISSITITLISAATGNVVVRPDISPQSIGAGSGAQTPFLGSDIRSPMDYILITANATNIINHGTAVNVVVYTVPTGKRAIIDYVHTQIGPSPSFPGDNNARFNLTTLSEDLALIYSNTDRFAQADVTGLSLLIGSGEVVRFIANNNSQSDNVPYTYTFHAREIF